MNQLLDNPQRLEAMSDEAIAFARGWDADAQATRLAALYRSLLRAPAPRLDANPMVATR